MSTKYWKLKINPSAFVGLLIKLYAGYIPKLLIPNRQNIHKPTRMQKENYLKRTPLSGSI